MSNEDVRIENFEKFYNCLMSNAPEGYSPWFFPCAKNGKNPCPQAILKINPESNGSWHHESAKLNKEQCIEHIKQGYNIGISARENDSLIIGDIDEPEVLNQLPDNTLTSTSRKRGGGHFFGWDKDGSAKINLPTDFGELRSNNQYVLACGSYVPFDLESEKDKKAFDKLPIEAQEDNLLGYYTIRSSLEPRQLSFSDCPKFFHDKIKENISAESEVKQREERKEYRDKDGKYSELFKLKVSDIIGLTPSNKRTGHPLHESDTDANFSLSEDGSIGHCWRHLVSLNAVQYLCVKAGYKKCEDAGTPHSNRGISKIKGDKKAFEVAYKEAIKLGLIEEWKGKNRTSIFGIMGQVERFYEEKPFCYDKSGLFKVWNDELKKYDIVDDVDMLNGIALLGIDTISSKNKTEITNALKQYGRTKIPKDAPLTWVQFKDIIYDWKTGETFNASPEYFMTSPLPFSPGETEETPTIDKFFTEWVGDDYKKTLEEIAAYSASSHQFMQRMIALVGGGANGKGSYLKFLSRLLGNDNVCSSELKELCNNQFETAMIYKKLLCIMGEVSGGDMSNTNQIKKLAGEDHIRFCFKGKTPFTDISVTTLINSTNSLPRSPDKTMGFYRKWLIVDFPNQFPIRDGVVESIPDYEMENFCRKLLRILKELNKTQKFFNEGSFQERMDRYEQRSNPVGVFIESNCEEDLGSQIILRDFCNYFNDYAKKNHVGMQSVRQISKILREEGIEMGKRTYDIGDGNKTSKQVILNMSIKTPEYLKKNTENTRNTVIPSQFTRKASTLTSGISGISGIFFKKCKFCGSDREIVETDLSKKAGENLNRCIDCKAIMNHIKTPEVSND